MTDESATAREAGFPTTTEAAWPAPGAAWYAVFVIVLSLLVNFLDRGILALLVPFIKADLRLSDTEMSLIMGFAFVMFYMIAGLPIARYSDRANRKRIIAFGLLLWGGATALCGAARSFASLFAFRVGVGVGEACTGPASFSLLGDYFEPSKLPRALSVMNFGYILGNGLAILIGGTIVGLFAASPTAHLPLLGELRIWQATFVVVGLPGLLVALLMLTVKEPPRRIPGEPPPVRAVVHFLGENRWVYGPIIVGIALNTIAAVGLASWGPTFFMRTYGWTVEQVALVLGLIWILALPFGSILGGAIAERWTRRGILDANIRLTLIVCAAAAPFMIAAPLMPSGGLAALLMGIGMFLTSMLLGPQNAAIQTVTPNRMRAQVSAVVLFALNIIGFGLGPTVTAVFTDYVFRDEMQIGSAIATCNALLPPLAILVMWMGLKPYGQAVEAIIAAEARGAVAAQAEGGTR
jgi:MFS family permease